MHSLESLREIRAMRYFLDWCCPEAGNMIRPYPRDTGQTGEVVAVATFDLATREITVKPAKPLKDYPR
jgi:hypothetical protein